jgi:hypothetical protein
VKISRKKLTKSGENLCRNFRFRESICENFRFRQNFRFRKSFRENFPFGMLIRIQEPPECVSRSEPLVENLSKTKIFHEIFREIGNFLRKPSRGQKFFAKIFATTFAKVKIFAKRNFAKSERIFAFRENEKRGFRFNPTKVFFNNNIFVLHPLVFFFTEYV